MTATALDTIRSSIGLLEQRLRRAATVAIEARDAINRAEQNIAVGTLLIMERDLADAEVLLKTILVLHKSAPEQKGGA